METGRESGIGFSTRLPAKYKISNIQKGKKKKKKKVDFAVTLLSAQTSLSCDGEVSPGPQVLPSSSAPRGLSLPRPGFPSSTARPGQSGWEETRSVKEEPVTPNTGPGVGEAILPSSSPREEGHCPSPQSRVAVGRVTSPHEDTTANSEQTVWSPREQGSKSGLCPSSPVQ